MRVDKFWSVKEFLNSRFPLNRDFVSTPTQARLRRANFEIKNRLIVSKNILSVFFFIFLFIFLIFGVSAQTTFGGDTGSYFSGDNSYSFSNPNYNQAGFFGSGFGRFGEVDPALEQEMCRERKDFIIQIAPGACTPAVVRSDLLAEQNVPVFCKLQAIQINPFIDASEIRSMRITSIGERDSMIAGEGYYRPRRQNFQDTGSGFLGSDNAGFLVINLKRQPDERELPDFVSGNLTARLQYDVPEGFGLGTKERIIPVMNDQEWEMSYLNYGFLDGEGFLRVDSVSGERARISVYRDKTHKYTTFNVGKGQTSGEKYLPGHYCNAAFSVTYVDAVKPEDKIRVAIDGEEYDVYEGDRFADNLCYVVDVSIDNLGTKSATFDCHGKKFTLELKNKPVDLIVDGDSGGFSVGEKIEGDIYLGEIDNSAAGMFVVLVEAENFNSEVRKNVVNFVEEIKKGKLDNGENMVVLFSGQDGKIADYKISFVEFSGGQDFDSENRNFENYFEKTIEQYKYIDGEFDGNVFLKSEASIGERALRDGIDFVEGKNKFATEHELRERLRENYEGEVFENQYDTEDASYIFELGEGSHVIRLEDVEEVGFESFGVLLEIDGNQKEATEGDFVYESGENTIELRSFDEDGARFVRRCGEQGGGAEVISVGSKMGICGKSIFVKQINLDRAVKIRLNPINRRVGSVVNLSYHIGIEKRAIELSPEKAMDRIEKLNKSIEKWENIADGLGKTVKGMKAACFSTSAALQIKNLFSGMGGKAIARQEVMRGEGGWNEFCAEHSSEYQSIDDCFGENAKEINRDVNKFADELKRINDEIERIESGSGMVLDSGFGSKVIDSSESKEAFFRANDEAFEGLEWSVAQDLSYEQMKEIVLYERLKGKSVSGQLGDVIENKIDSLNGEIEDLRIEANRETEADQNGILGRVHVNVKRPSDPRALQYIYGGAVTQQNNKYDVGIATPIEKVVYDRKEYYVILKQIEGSSQYVIDKAGEDVPLVYDLQGNRIADEDAQEIASEFDMFTQFTSSSYSNKYKNPEVLYYENEPYKGMPAIVPFDTTNGWYAATKQTLPVFGNVGAFHDSGRVSSFWICNVGEDGKQEFNAGKDTCALFNVHTGQAMDVFPGLSESEARRKVRDGMQALERAADQYKKGVKTITISGKRIKVGNPAVNLPGIQCQDFMSPTDCKILFNVCDPVICPSSRCNLGGKFYANDVIATGIVGGVFMCLPNAREGIAVPVCLTGIHAGIENYVSILRASRECLQEAVDNGRYIGICDQITAIYKCEFFWRQISPLINTILPKVLEFATGGVSRGGGEYMFAQSSWDNMQNSIDYFKSEYAENSLRAFQIRSTEEIGTPVCKTFVSTVFPNKFKTLIEPDSPTQFTAWFDEIPMTTATTPAMSQYKVFYHIFAGNDQGVQFNVYLKDAPGASFYESAGMQHVATGFVRKGEFVSESRDDLQSAAGFQQLCVRVNAQEECGFKRVSTSFALDYLQDKYIKEQMTETGITSEKECIAGTPSAWALGAGGLSAQSLTEDALTPGIYQRGIIRVCATDNPGSSTNPERWQEVGHCGNTQIKCWLDKESIYKAFTDGHVGAINRTIDSLNEAAEQYEFENAFVQDQEEVDAKIAEIRNMIDDLVAIDSFEIIEPNSKVVLAELSVLENPNEYYLDSDRDAEVNYLKAQIYELVAGLAWEDVLAGRTMAMEKMAVGVPESEEEEEEDDEEEEKRCEDCGIGLTNWCDKEECEDLGDNCEFDDGWFWNGCREREEDILEIDVEDRKYTNEEIERAIRSSGKVSEKCSTFVDEIKKYSDKYEVNSLFVTAVMMQESSCNKDAVSKTRCKGLMQICSFDLCTNIGTKNQIINQFDKNIECGVSILRQKYDKNKDGKVLECDGREINYVGWAAGLRGYNGWGCNDDNEYVDNVYQRYISLKESLT